MHIGDMGKKLKNEARLDDGSIVTIDLACRRSAIPLNDSFEYLGQGIYHRINGALQFSTSEEVKTHFFKRKVTSHAE